MKVKVPEPINNKELYSLRCENEQFSLEEFERLIQEIGKNIGSVCEELETGKYSVVDYNLLFYRGDLSEGNYLEGGVCSGGFFLSVEEGRKYSFPDFKKECKENLEEVLQDFETNPSPVSAYISVSASLDSITREVDAMDPNPH